MRPVNEVAVVPVKFISSESMSRRPEVGKPLVELTLALVAAAVATVVVSPGEQSAIRLEGESLKIALSDRHHIRARSDTRDLNGAESALGRAVAELSEAVVSPGEHGAVGFQGTGMVAPRRNCHD